MTSTADKPAARPALRRRIVLVAALLAIALPLLAATVWFLSYDSRAAALDAARSGDCAKLRFALSMRPALLRDPDARLGLLREAAAHSQPDTLDLLVSRGVAIDTRDRDGLTLLLEAVRAGDAALARFLLERGADPNAETPRHETPLVLAVEAANADLVRLLMERGADPLDPREAGRTVLDRPWTPQTFPVARILLERGVVADPFYLDSALALAFERGDRALAGSYLSTYPSVNRPSKVRAATAAPLLHLAVQQKHYGVALLLLAQGANPNLRDDRRRTALDTAVDAEPRSYEIIRPLLAERAAAGIERLYPALEMALDAGDAAVVKSYLAALPNLNNLRDAKGQSLLHYAALTGNVAAAQVLMANGADVNTWSWQGMAPLHLAATAPRAAKELTALLIAGKADVNAPDLFERTPLYAAVLNGASLDVIRLLLESGAKVDARCCDKFTPLHRAMAAGKKDVVRLLLEFKADINAQDPTGKALLHYAAADGDKDLVQYLIDHGAWCNLKDYSGSRPIRYALQNGHSDVADMLAPKTDKRPPKR